MSAKTIKTFNKTYFDKKGNRRALGFDKPPLNIGESGPSCKSASPSSFGHSGFTGTYFWVDPANNSIFIFLSNRTFPDASNRKLIKDDIRTKIHQEFYNAFEYRITSYNVCYTKLLRNVKALIFDLDGTLADTMPYHYEAWRLTAEAHGMTMTKDFLRSMMGSAAKVIARKLCENHGITEIV